MKSQAKPWMVLVIVLVLVCEVIGITTSVALVAAASAIRGTPPRIVQVIQALAASPTSIPARTPRPTFTTTPLPTANLLPTVTELPTGTPARTSTKKPTSTRTRIPPVQSTTTPTVPAASLYPFRVEAIRCYHSAESFVEGLVLERWGNAADKFSGINGLRVRMSYAPNGPAVDPDAVTETHTLNDAVFPFNTYSGWFGHPVASGAAPGQVRYVWVVDESGKALSNTADGKAKFDAGTGDTACWNVQITFVKVQ